ncbi:MAG TPA: flagellar basal body P-ring formation chaperone FlgA [Geobacteraceae bacterium]|nr:flagellar basal body P-ring formation chaperone FlgA [Geobacteraceae bacterium]
MKGLVSIIIAVLMVIGAQATPLPAGESNVLNEGRVRKILTDYLLQKTGLAEGAVKLKRLGFSGEIVLPAGNPDFEVVSPRDWEGWGRCALALIVRIDDRVVRNIPLNVEVEALADVPVTARELEQGMVVGKGDVIVQKRDMATLPARVCRNPGDALGKRVRVGMRANSILRCDYLERLPLVKSGQMVTIVAENEKFRITASGRARANGAEGDTVMVQNLNAQKEIPAVVVDANTVRVEF